MNNYNTLRGVGFVGNYPVGVYESEAEDLVRACILRHIRQRDCPKVVTGLKTDFERLAIAQTLRLKNEGAPVLLAVVGAFGHFLPLIRRPVEWAAKYGMPVNLSAQIDYKILAGGKEDDLQTASRIRTKLILRHCHTVYVYYNDKQVPRDTLAHHFITLGLKDQTHVVNLFEPDDGDELR